LLFGTALCTVVSLSTPATAHAQAWNWQGGARATLEHNSNQALTVANSPALLTARLTATGRAGRQAPIGRSEGEAELVFDASRQAGRGDGSVLGRVTLNHQIEALRDSGSARIGHRRNRPIENARTASEAAFGTGEQDVTELALSWSHAFSERLSAELDTGRSRTRVSAPSAGQGYALANGSAGLRFRFSEITTLTGSLGRTRQRLDGNGLLIDIDTLRLGGSMTASETLSFRLDAAHSATTQVFTLRALVCPLPASFCQGGLVPFVLAEQVARSRRSQTQYNVSGQWRWSETSTFAARASRALTAGVQGVSLEDSHGLDVAHDAGPDTSVSLAWQQSRSTLAGQPGASAGRLQSLALVANHRLGERLSLLGQLQHRRYSRGTLDTGASGTVLSISLQYLGATVPLPH